MKYFSTFSGIGAFEVATQGMDFECVGYSEVDKYALQIYQKHFPDHKNYGDITKIDIPNLPDFDLLVGGSPCQDLSIAKKNRQGLQGDRSKLFYKFLEILKVKKPKYFLLENVNSMSKENKDIISDLMGVEPVMINAALVSAQNRKRLFWCNWEVNQPKDRNIYLKDILEKKVDEKYFSSETAIKNNFRVLRNLRNPNQKSKALTATMWKGDGNDGMTTIRVGQIGKGGQGDRIYSIDGKSICLSAHGGGRGAKTGLYLIKGCASRTYPRTKKEGVKRNKQIEIRKDEKSNSLTTVQTDSMVAFKSYVRKLTPIECERLQCFPDNWTAGISNTQRYKCLGNAFNVEVIKHIINCIYANKGNTK